MELYSKRLGRWTQLTAVGCGGSYDESPVAGPAARHPSPVLGRQRRGGPSRTYGRAKGTWLASPATGSSPFTGGALAYLQRTARRVTPKGRPPRTLCFAKRSMRGGVPQAAGPVAPVNSSVRRAPLWAVRLRLTALPSPTPAAWLRQAKPRGYPGSVAGPAAADRTKWQEAGTTRLSWTAGAATPQSTPPPRTAGRTNRPNRGRGSRLAPGPPRRCGCR